MPTSEPTRASPYEPGQGLFHGCDVGMCGWSDDEYAEDHEAHDEGYPPPSSPTCAICGPLPCHHGGSR